MRRTWIASVFLGTSAFAGFATDELKRFEFTEPHMGTLVRIKLYASDEHTAKEAAKAAFARIVQLNAIFSDYDADSELMRIIETYKPGRPIAVSGELRDALVLAQSIAKKTKGAFDVTSGTHTRNWRMTRRTGELPSRNAIEKAKAASGFDKISVEESGTKITLSVGGMRLDFGGIAKGIAADAALAVLKKQGFKRAVVAIGGDIAIGDPPPGKDGWVTRIELNDGRKRSLMLRNCGVSTSGDTEQFLPIDGKRYSHIVDPRTGLGSTNRISASVIAPRAALSDPLATAICVLNPDDPKEITGQFKNTRAIVAEKPAR